MRINASLCFRKLKGCQNRVRHVASNVELKKLAPKVQNFVEEGAKVFQADRVHVLNGSKEESHHLTEILVENGQAKPLKKLDNWYAEI